MQLYKLESSQFAKDPKQLFSCSALGRLLSQNLITKTSKFLRRDNVDELNVIVQKNKAEAYGILLFFLLFIVQVHLICSAVVFC